MKQYRVLSFFIILLPSLVYSQSITITSPSAAVVVKEADEFSVDELKNAWDFNEVRDFGWDQNFTGNSVKVLNGIWSGTNAVAGGYVFPLFPGFKRSLFSEGMPGDKKLPRLGINHRIDSSKYSLLSYRLNNSNRGSFAIYWESNEAKQEYWPDPSSPKGASFDGYYHWNVSYLNSGFTHYSFDLKNLSSHFQQVQGSWSGQPFALRIDPSVFGAAGATTQVDWIRLSDPASAPNHTITWNSNGISTFAIITVYYDTDSSGYDGTPMVRFTSGNNPGTYTFPTATFPPGTYRFYVTAQVASGGSYQGAVTSSGYSNPLTITPKPAGYFVAPTMTSGEEYAQSVVGNAWDMDSATDVPNLNPAVWPDEFRQFSNQSFANNAQAEAGTKVFNALANPPINGATESDVQVHLNVSNASPIDTGKYRYLVYRVEVDGTNYPTIHDKVEKGWVMRPVWWNNNFTDDHNRAKAHVLYEGWNTYGTDMMDSSIMEYGSAWDSQLTFNNLRVDPLETPIHTAFNLDYVRLFSENRAPAGTYDIRYKVENVGSGTVSTSIYYDTNDSGYDGTLITTLSGQTAGDYTYSWNTASLPAGSSYYIYMVMSNGVSSTKFYSPVHVKIGPYTPAKRSVPPKFDFDGDGRSDQAVYRASASGGQFYMNKSTSGSQVIQWGDNRFEPVVGDIDGDGISDRGLVVSTGGFLVWYIVRSSDGLTYARTWGYPGDIPVIADYNGNGRDELAIYRQGAWWVLDEEDRGYVRYWGVPDIDIPVPADYDGDGKDDIAIFRKTDGFWWILNSGFDTKVTSSFRYAGQWGLPWVGDKVVPGDYTGDGKADLAVWRPTDGTWYVKNIQDGSVISKQWGLFGDIPFAGHDGNGDGVKDFVVFRPSNGFWYYNYRNDATHALQYGLPGDDLPFGRPYE